MERRRLRLATHQYSSAGLYFVTTCARERACVFGAVRNERVILSPLGAVALNRLLAILDHHATVTIDSFVVMPNHVHVVIALGESHNIELGDLVGTFKAAVSRSAGRPRIWQRGYHDHIVRDERDLERVREYIATNPIRWALDPENPDRRS